MKLDIGQILGNVGQFVNQRAETYNANNVRAARLWQQDWNTVNPQDRQFLQDRTLSMAPVSSMKIIPRAELNAFAPLAKSYLLNSNTSNPNYFFSGRAQQEEAALREVAKRVLGQGEGEIKSLIKKLSDEFQYGRIGGSTGYTKGAGGLFSGSKPK